MSCFLVLNSFAGDDQEAAAKKLALMFRMAPQQASTIMKKVSQGQVWRTPKEISDQQAAVAENYLKGIGFQVERSGEQAVADQIAGSVTLAEEPSREGAGVGLLGGEDLMEAEPPSGPPGTGSGLRPPGNGGTTNPGDSPPQEMPIGFHGTGGGLFKIMLVNWILTFLTLGIYSFWGKTKVRRYLCEQSSFVGDRFYYHGTGGELFKGALIFGVTFGLLNLGVYSIGQVWGLDTQIAAQTALFVLILFLLPVIMVGAFRYRLSRTAWRGIRFSFRGKRKSAVWLYVKGYLLMIFTFGFYWPFFAIAQQKFWRGESYFGSQSFKYDGKGQDIFKAFLLVILVYVVAFAVPYTFKQQLPNVGDNYIVLIMYIIIAFGYIWFTVFMDRYNWSKTQFAGGRFTYDATVGQWFTLTLTNFLLVLFTMGLAFPLATIRSRQFLADHLIVAGNMQLSQVVQEAQKSSALGEGAADGFDMDIDIGI